MKEEGNGEKPGNWTRQQRGEREGKRKLLQQRERKKEIRKRGEEDKRKRARRTERHV